ncbi:MAG: hypothetical protein MJK04_23255 [Psychrosphaera sp.]|nr:hypothetical protein [Psychrosphaera sp.]
MAIQVKQMVVKSNISSSEQSTAGQETDEPEPKCGDKPEAQIQAKAESRSFTRLRNEIRER